MVGLPFADHLLPRTAGIEGPRRFLEARLRDGDQPPPERLEAVRIQIDAVLGAQHQLEQVPPAREVAPGFVQQRFLQVAPEFVEGTRRGFARPRQLGPRSAGPRREPAGEVLQERHAAPGLLQRGVHPRARDDRRVGQIGAGLPQEPRHVLKSPGGGAGPVRQGRELTLRQVVDTVQDFVKVGGRVAEGGARLLQLARFDLEGAEDDPDVQRFVGRRSGDRLDEPRQIPPIRRDAPSTPVERLGAAVDETIVVVVDSHRGGRRRILAPGEAQDLVDQGRKPRVHGWLSLRKVAGFAGLYRNP